MDLQKITLESPIIRGETTITELGLRKPDSGALRGASLRGLLDMEVDDIAKVLPRVSEPPLIPAEVSRLDPADLMQAGMVIASFLLPKRMIAEAEAAISLH